MRTDSRIYAHQRRTLRHPAQSCDRRTRAWGIQHELYHPRSLHLVVAGLRLLIAGILALAVITCVERDTWAGFVVSAAPCSTGITTASSGEGGVVNVEVTPTTDIDLTSIFNCEGGDFKVIWSGAVNVTGTIYIGLGTTVSILGDIDSNATEQTTSAEIYSSSTSGGSGNSTSDNALDILTEALSIPNGLTSAVVGVGSWDVDADTDKSISFGPIFSLDSGQLFLENMAVRGGFVVNTTANGEAVSGGGVHALNSNVTVTGCEFEDNFAQFWGGGIYANISTVILVDSVFRGCRAGFQSSAGEEDVDGAGGAIATESSDVLIDGCVFEECYASKKGGGMHQGTGQLSVLNSVFYNNSAGSDNVEDEVEIGEGAALSFTNCVVSFHGLSTCGVNDTIFSYNHAGRKGGAVVIASGSSPSYVEFHRCTVANTTTGLYIEDDPQGEGGAFAVGEGIWLLIDDCIVSNNFCGKKGGVLTLSSGSDWKDEPGPTVILKNSTFELNTASAQNGGVVYLGEYSAVTVAGEGNVFRWNECNTEGAVFAGTSSSNITVEGGVFSYNNADADGGVFWTNGLVEILGGQFLNNKASDRGGILFAADDSTAILADGVFVGNEAYDGGVAHVGNNAILSVENGFFSSNTADNSGGAFVVSDGGTLQITGGNFSSNKADFGGFLYKEGDGTASCKGASIVENEGVDGGAIYAVDEASLDWACDLVENSALAGPAIYARDGSSVVLRGITLLDNVIARGSVVFVVDSDLRTYQVNFKDTTKSSDLSAVQVDADSIYMAEGTSFEGFEGEAIVYSEGELYLDDCDFSGSTASQLVYSEPNTTAVIRNTVLGDNNYLALATASSQAETIPNANSLTNANFTCGESGGRAESGSSASSSNSLESSPCSEGSLCLEGDLGVYCQCYLQLSTPEQRCVSGTASALELAIKTEPDITFFPDMLEGDLLLSYSVPASTSSTTNRSTIKPTGSSSSTATSITSEEANSSTQIDNRGTTNSGSSSTTDGASEIGVVWNVAALQQSIYGRSAMEWTVFPSTGLLLPGESITLRVVTLPSTSFDGTTNVTFVAAEILSTSDALTTSTMSEQSDTEDDGPAAAPQAQVTVTSSTSQLWNDSAIGISGWVSNTSATFNVTFYHCDTGQVWNASFGDSGNCDLCGDVVDGEEEGVECDEPGATIKTLPLVDGYWRASLEVVYIRECYSEDACKGGSNVASVEDYCNEGYTGPECAVCDSGYGRGAADECHQCTTSFKAVMYFILTVSIILGLVVVAHLAIYLVSGGEAVLSIVARTKESVGVPQRHGRVRVRRSGGAGDIGVTNSGTGNKTRLNSSSGHGIEMSSYIGRKPIIPDGSGSAAIRSRKIGSRLRSGAGIGGMVGSTFPPKRFNAGCMTSEPSASTTRADPAETLLERGNDSPSLPRLPADATQRFERCGSSNNDMVGSSCTPRHSTFATSAQQPRGRSRTFIDEGPRKGENQPPSGEERPQQKGDRQRTTTDKFLIILAKLPLSKLKIVIVVWQISSAFADVTNVEYPPIYEKFLSAIGMFSLDMTWILSAACLTTEVSFYGKLLTVTIGPLIIFGLLGTTFYIGAKQVSPVAAPGQESQRGRNISRDTNATRKMTSSISGRSVRHNTNSSRTVEAPPSTRLLWSRGGHWRRSDKSAITVALSPNETQSQRQCWLPTAAGDSAGQTLPAGDQEVSSTNDLSATMDQAAVNRCDRSISQACSEGLGEAMSQQTSSLGSPRRSSVKPQRSMRGVWKAGPGHVADSEQDCLWGLLARHTTMTLIMLYLVYSQVSTVVFQTFSCEDFPEIGISYLRADRRIECYTTTHTAYKTYAAVMILLYPLGIPGVFYYLLSSEGSSINPGIGNDLPEPRSLNEIMDCKIEKRNQDARIAPIAFLWDAYYPNRFYYEVFECLRRLVLTGLLVFLVPDTSGQVAFSCVFSFVSLLAFELQRPHIDDLEILLYRAGCLVNFFTNFLALMIKAEVADKDSPSSAAYSVVLIMVNVMFFLSIWGNTLATILALFSRRHFQGIIFGVNIVHDDTVDTVISFAKKNDSNGDGADFKVDNEMVPAWDGGLIDVKSSNGSVPRSGSPHLPV